MRIVFAGTPEFAVVILEALLERARSSGDLDVIAVYTQPDRPAGRGRKRTKGPVKRLAEAHAIPVHQPQTCRDPSVREELIRLEPEVLVVVAYGLILPPEVLAIPRHGCINVHASLLPRWRGAAPIQRAILAGDTETGVSIMQMEEGLDTGPVLRADTCPINVKDTAGTLHDRLARLGAESLVRVLGDLKSGTARPIPQDGTLATDSGRLAKSEGLLDWDRPALELERKVRAFVPWPVAYTTFQGQTLRVWEAAAVEAKKDKIAPPGTITACRPTGIDIATREGELRLLTVQKPGARPVPVADFLNGFRVRQPPES